MTPAAGSRFARDVREALTRSPRQLPCEYFYDDVGTALFDAITWLPEYGLTRAEERILQTARFELEADLVVELGSGTGRKTRWVLEALGARTVYCPIDVSSHALARCEREIEGLARVLPVEGTYLDGLPRALAHRPPGGRALVLFLGSTIGNFDPRSAAAFLRAVRRNLRLGDGLLLGADLVKPTGQLLAAYDDPAGVTAAFNRNLLARINRELGANFDPRCFAHEARYNARRRRVEMHLRSLERQAVDVAGLALVFESGETIWTESSYKFELPALRATARRTGFAERGEWVDDEWPFTVMHWTAAGGRKT